MEGGTAVVSDDEGLILLESAGEGAVTWTPTTAGTRRLTHEVKRADGSVAETLTARFEVGKRAAMVTLSGLEWTYDGTAKSVGVATEPTGLTVVVTYGGTEEAPIHAGSYAVVAEVADENWEGRAEGTLDQLP